MLYYKKQKIASINDIYEKYSKSEFKSPYRSTIPLIFLFKNNQIPFGTKNTSDVKYFFEFETPVTKGIGRPSCTDLMIEYANGCIGIEAKRTEPPYSKVKSWLGESHNKKLVLEGWLEMINKHTGLKVKMKEISHLPYQLIHRVASACSLSKEKPEVIYIAFDLSEKMVKYYLESLEEFSRILSHKIDLYFYSYTIEKTESWAILENLWDLGERDLSKSVISYLKNEEPIELTIKLKRKINKPIDL